MKKVCCLILLLIPTVVHGADWPQWMGPNRDGIWLETGIVAELPKGGPKQLWREPIGSGYSGPAVVNGKLYVMDYQTKADFRKLSNPASRPKIQGQERVICLDAKTGKTIWTHAYDCPYEISYPSGPRCTPTVIGGKVYSLGSEGDLFCLEAEKGAVIWQKNFKKHYSAKTPVWGFCGHPLVEGTNLICVVGGENACAVAFNKDTGDEVWKALSAREPGYAPPTMLESGGKRQVLIWNSDTLNSLDPVTGSVHWAVDLQASYAMSIMAPQRLGNYLYAGGIGGKSVMLELAADKPAVKELWRGTAKTGVYPVNMTPLLADGCIYGCDQQGEFMAADIKTGTRRWANTDPFNGKKYPNGTAFMVRNGDQYFLFSETGELLTAKLSPEKCEITSRAKLVAPTNVSFGRDVVWSHPAFANRCIYVRNDKEIACFSLSKD